MQFLSAQVLNMFGLFVLYRLQQGNPENLESI